MGLPADRPEADGAESRLLVVKQAMIRAPLAIESGQRITLGRDSPDSDSDSVMIQVGPGPEPEKDKETY